MTFLVATRSSCSRLQVGCVVVNAETNRLLSTGYNGSSPGERNPCISNTPGQCGHSLHAEYNALLDTGRIWFAYRPDIHIYVTHLPCFNCAKLIVTKCYTLNIKTVYYLNNYTYQECRKLFKQAKIKLVKLNLPKE